MCGVFSVVICIIQQLLVIILSVSTPIKVLLPLFASCHNFLFKLLYRNCRSYSIPRCEINPALLLLDIYVIRYPGPDSTHSVRTFANCRINSQYRNLIGLIQSI